MITAPPAGHWSDLLGAPSGACISECTRYRTLLWRTLRGPAPPLVFVMLNPSTADAFKSDPTITRCLGFADREGASGIVVVNLSPYRATDPKDLERAHREGTDVLWSEHNRTAVDVACSLGPVVLAWGAGVRPWMDGAARMVRSIAQAPLCLGKTKMGEPRHPLMLQSTAPLMSFP